MCLANLLFMIFLKFFFKIIVLWYLHKMILNYIYDFRFTIYKINTILNYLARLNKCIKNCLF